MTNAFGVTCNTAIESHRRHSDLQEESAERLLYKIAILSLTVRVLLETNALNATESWNLSGSGLNLSNYDPSTPGNFSSDDLKYEYSLANVSDADVLYDQPTCFEDFEDYRDKPQTMKEDA